MTTVKTEEVGDGGTLSRTTMDREHQTLTETEEDALVRIEAMEERLQMQTFEGCLMDASVCLWFACTDVCPPGG